MIYLGLSSATQVSDPKVVEEGIRMVLSQFKAVLGENGVEEIEPGKGDAFDHNSTKRSNLSRVKKWRRGRSAIDTQRFLTEWSIDSSSDSYRVRGRFRLAMEEFHGEIESHNVKEDYYELLE